MSISIASQLSLSLGRLEDMGLYTLANVYVPQGKKLA